MTDRYKYGWCWAHEGQGCVEQCPGDGRDCGRQLRGKVEAAMSHPQIKALITAADAVRTRWVSGMPEYSAQDVDDAIRELAEALKPFER